MLEKERDLLKRDERTQTERRPLMERREDQEEGRLTPMTQMERLFDEMFKKPFFHLWTQRMSGEELEELNPPIDIYEDGDSVVVKAEIPGIRREDLDVQLSPVSITISGQKSKEQRVERKDFYRLESSYGSFIRTCRLPVATLTDTAKASFRDGILEGRILKKTEATSDRVKKLTIE
ncbi:Hsp20/alpha crystallin family protein [Geomonas ferrireducens]|uniref:Hsp20/alpha crystallin family protein n=1 Tax=Geomonas ferrireducens TaxID=2570227 RepID=UPI0010A8F201|nr:Hsp20/alpha crystallin family protein [Geomonas ferrireducens]